MSKKYKIFKTLYTDCSFPPVKQMTHTGASRARLADYS